jgi:Apea-like HEPN
VPRDFQPSQWFDRLNTVWWFVALLRFRATPFVLVPVVASVPFAKAKDDAEEIHFWPVEVEQRLLVVEEKVSHEIGMHDLEWIKRHWWDAGKLMNRSEEFNLLFQACAQCVFTRNPVLLSLWGALEGMFSPAKTELRFRVSANIAAYLEPQGRARMELQKRLAKLYDARSQAAHGGSDLPKEALRDPYALTKRVITKMIEGNAVPNREKLDAALFGVDAE